MPIGTAASWKQCQVLLFGDLSLLRFKDRLRRLLHVKTNPLLTSFFDRVSYALRRQLGTLPEEEQNLFPRFTTLIDLVAKFGETDCASVLGFFLLSVHEVAQSIVYFTEGSKPYPPPPNTYVIGPCTGGFAAAAISCSQSLSDLVSNGVRAVLAAFSAALRSFLVGQSLLPRAKSTQTQPNKSWSAVLNAQGDISLEEMVQEYTNIKTTTLSGRPSVLQDFLTTNVHRVKSQYLEIESPYHSAHLFDAADVERIVSHVQRADVEDATRQAQRIPLISSSTGKVVTASDFTDLLQIVVREALQEPVRWDLMLESFSTLLTEAQTQECTILPFSSNAASMLSTALLGRDPNIQVVIQDVSSPQSKGKSTPTPPTGRFEHSKIAIIGYSGRFPSSASNEAFWELLKDGRDVHREIPADRFDWKTHYDPTGKTRNTSRVKSGCFIDEPGLFDTSFFNMSPREAENTDPAQRLAITTTYEAMEMAGMVRNRTPSTQQDRIGVFFGTTSDDWREVNSGQDVGTYFIPGGNRAFVPGRISYFFRFSGPSLSIDTACSSSFAAIQAACGYLWRGECDTTIAGGTNILTNPDNFAGLDRGHFLSTTGNCNAFDDQANGYCRSDAVGTVILKRLEDAEADNDPIFGVIAGTNTNHCGQTDSITRPHEADQTSVFKRITRYADVDPLDVSYIEMHGTGTQAGDAVEMKSVLAVFGPDYTRTKVQPARPLHIGSAKASIGHAESASGVCSLIKVLMMMKYSEIPRHCGIKTSINHNYPLDLARRGVFIPLESTPWRRQDAVSGKRAAFLNNFSAAGGNTAILLEDAPASAPLPMIKDSRPVQIVTVTAKSPKSLLANTNSLVSFLETKDRSVSLSALSYTTTARRMHHNYRVIVSGPDIASVISVLKIRAGEIQASLASLKPVPTARKKKPQVVFMFSGQGALYAELGKSLLVTNTTFRASIVRLNRLAEIQGFPTFLGLIDGSTTAADLRSANAIVSHLALVCVQIALTELWMSWGVVPAAVVGHSLGEYAALHAAGVLSIADVIYLVGTRATLLEARCRAGTHAMLAIKGSLDIAEKLIHQGSEGEVCELACANQPSGYVISGPVDKISQISGAAVDMGIETVRLNIPFAFHSAQVDPILSEFERAAGQGVAYHPPVVPFLSPLLAKLVPAGDEHTLNASYLTAACRGTVDFKGAHEAFATAQAEDGGFVLGAAERTIWLEIGPHPICTGMVKGTLGSHVKTATTLRQNVEAYKTMSATIEVLYLAGVEVNWNEYHRDFPVSHQVLELPMYAWDLKNYWIDYRNDFCLTKGGGFIKQPAVKEAVMPKYISPCAQQIVEESHGADESTLVVESDIFDDRLLPVLQGHLVNGAALCPSSMYADLALTLANYMLIRGPNPPSATTGLEVNNVKAENPLIARLTETTHRFRVSATAEWSSSLIFMTIFSVDGNGKRTTSHAKLEVRVTPQQRWANEWKRNAHLITARVDALHQSIHVDEPNNDSHLIKRGMAYKLFSTLVQYSRDYQGMAEVILDSKRLEAVATVKFLVGQEGFHLNPKWIDSLGHIAGFIMNVNDNVDSRTQVFINHGWERMRIAEPFQAGKTYHAYNRMQLVEKTTYVGDTYILEQGRIVAIFEGVTPPKHNSQLPVPAPQSVKTKSTSNPSSMAFGRVLAIIGQEVGLNPSELGVENELAELGIDSLLSITITSKIHDELGLEFPPSLFADGSTLGDLKVWVVKGESDGVSSACSSSESSSDQESQETQFTSSATSAYQGATQQGQSSSGRTSAALILRQIIAEETRVAIDELKVSTCLADIGIDSLLGLSISGKLQETMDVDIPGSMFSEFETLQDIEEALLKALGLDLSNPKQATSILLSGSPQAARLIFFLFPDGSGSASSYATLARAINTRSVAVYGLNCPWRKIGAEMTRTGVTMSTMISRYVSEVRRLIQPLSDHVPFVALGGWSAGGILALEAARQLKQQPEVIRVGKLVLLDSPNPIGLQNPPEKMYDFFDSLGIFGDGKAKTPEWLRAHFDAFLRILDAYNPEPLFEIPASLIVYARDGVCKDPDGPTMETHPDDPREMLWLLNNRTDFSAHGWASVLGQEKLSVRVLDEVNHFSLMDPGPKMKEMGQIVTDFLVGG
ncbi:polyketide synthase [Leptodontidium sp. 2 PMI_412]|nr:polyketide synthase [Leptodontidium sp. 2 PMI_412]